MTDNPSVVFPRPGETAVEDRPVPEPAADQLLVRTTLSLISAGTELMLRSGRARAGSAWARKTSYPYYPGYCSCGEVIAVGRELDDSWLGRQVVSLRSHAAFTTPTLDLVRPLPAGVAADDAVFTPLAEVAMNGLRRGRLRWGESAAVVGLGVLGQLTVRLCHLAGAARVFGIDRAASRVRRIPPQPGVHALAGEAPDLVDSVRERNLGRRVDVLFELTGNPEAIAPQLALLRRQGRFVILSSPSGDSLFDFHDLCNRSSITIVGAHYLSFPPVATADHPWTGARHGELFLDAVKQGRLAAADMITHRVPFARAPDAYELLASHPQEALGVVIEWQA